MLLFLNYISGGETSHGDFEIQSRFGVGLDEESTVDIGGGSAQELAVGKEAACGSGHGGGIVGGEDCALYGPCTQQLRCAE